MTFRTCNPLYGWRWFRRGISLFLAQPWPWLALVSMVFFLTLLLATLPLLGLIAVYLLMPGVTAGLMLGAQEVAHGRPLRFPFLIRAIRQNPRPLVGVGGINFLAMLASTLLLSLGWGEEFQRLIELMNSSATDVEVLREAMQSLTVPSLLNLVFFLLLTMANWFAPSLIVFRNLSAGAAMRASFKASLSNFAPFLVHGLLFIGLTVMLSLLLGLLLGLINPLLGGLTGLDAFLIFPLVCALFAQILAAMYVSYGDVFETGEKA